MNEDAEPVLVDCEYCQGKHEKDKVQFCPLNPNKPAPYGSSVIERLMAEAGYAYNLPGETVDADPNKSAPEALQYVEEIATFDQAYFDKLLTGFRGIRRRDLLYGSWVSSREKPATHITHNLRTKVTEQGDLVIILESHGTEMRETLAPGQVVNLFLDWLQSVDTNNRAYAWERLNKEGKHE